MTTVRGIWIRQHLLLPTNSNHSRSRKWFCHWSLISIRSLRRIITFRQFLLITFLSSLISLFILSGYLSRKSTPSRRHSPPPVPAFHCPVASRATLNDEHIEDPHDVFFHDNTSTSQLKLDPKVLVFVESQYSLLGRQIVELLEAARIKTKIEISSKSLPLLTNADKGKFAVIIFENLEKYVYMNRWNADILRKYCQEYHVGIIGFAPHVADLKTSTYVKGLPLVIHHGLHLKDYFVYPDSPILRISRGGPVHFGPLSVNRWSGFELTTSSFQVVAESTHIINESSTTTSGNETVREEKVPTIVYDNGSIDEVRRIFFAGGFDVWVNKVLLLDSISFLSQGRLSLPLKRYLLIDIDDIFVGEPGTRIKPNDVDVLIATQQRFRQIIPGFTFNLGFSGKYYHRGTDEEDEGDDALLKNANQFWWFCHMWSHSQPHLYNVTVLESEMKLNRDFAREHGIPTNSSYSVAPHHSGVYPVHEPLYEAWKSVWEVKVTSTEEYPHLRPARLRRGFIHQGIAVLPRQTCGLYTHTLWYDRYPSSSDKLERILRGGELFYSFVLNPMNIFMTHMGNYANDRLAIYSFETVFSFLRCWTNLNIETLKPTKLATKYFQSHPDEVDPIWVNPCLDKRHLAIWASNKTCDRLPKFLIVGPQKTGTTALYTFLSLHPSVINNTPSPETFEEIQFFNGKNYYKGIDWYIDFFQYPPNHDQRSHHHVSFFEKSATYFDGDLVPLRVHSLLPNSKIVVILISPAKRAYSWYHHMRAHRDVTALNYSFFDVISADEKSSPKPLRDLKHRCLNPGMYAQHFDRWLNYFSPQQIMIVDGEELISDPVSVMSKIQLFLKLEPCVDYTDLIRFNSKKGFFCPIDELNNNVTRCLGRGKGRSYPDMDDESSKHLRKFFVPHNIALSKLLTKLRQPVPSWLEEDLTHVEV